MAGSFSESQFSRGNFITRERVKLWAIAIAVGWIVAIGYLAITAHGLNDYSGRPLGSDFSNIYAAGTLANDGHPSAPFDPVFQAARERAIFGSKTQFYGWHYPPFFLLVASALATLPYIPALLVWQIGSFSFYLLSLSRLTAESPSPELRNDSHWLLLVCAFPAVFINLTHGHNGFLTAALLAGGLAALQTRPMLAGIFFGLVAYKPQYAVLLPFALIAGGYWRSACAAAATVGVLACAVTTFYGPEIWPAFFTSMHFTRTVVLEAGGAGWFKIQSLFSLVRMWGGSVSLAYAVQGTAILGVLATIIKIWSNNSRFGVKAALLCLGSFIVTPYAFDYDMMILAPAILLLVAETRNVGAPPFRIFTIASLWLLPLIARPLGEIGMPIGATSILAAFCLIAWQELGTHAAMRNEPEFA